MSDFITSAAADQTPLQSMILEVLAARHRLGEVLWTFNADRSTVRALRTLEASGLVETMGGIIPRTVRASLTDAGRLLWLSPTYQHPDRPTRCAASSCAMSRSR